MVALVCVCVCVCEWVCVSAGRGGGGLSEFSLTQNAGMQETTKSYLRARPSVCECEPGRSGVARSEGRFALQNKQY